MKSQDTCEFRVQIAFSSIVLIFCMYKLTVTPENQGSNAIYWSGITSILAWWMPSPGGRKEGQPSIEMDHVNIEKAETKIAGKTQDVSLNMDQDSLRSLTKN